MEHSSSESFFANLKDFPIYAITKSFIKELIFHDLKLSSLLKYFIYKKNYHKFSNNYSNIFIKLIFIYLFF